MAMGTGWASPVVAQTNLVVCVVLVERILRSSPWGQIELKTATPAKTQKKYQNKLGLFSFRQNEFETYSFVPGVPKMQSVSFSLVFVVIVGVVGLGQGLDLGSRQSSSRRKMESPATNKVWPWSLVSRNVWSERSIVGQELAEVASWRLGWVFSKESF